MEMVQAVSWSRRSGAKQCCTIFIGAFTLKNLLRHFFLFLPTLLSWNSNLVCPAEIEALEYCENDVMSELSNTGGDRGYVYRVCFLRWAEDGAAICCTI